MEDKYSLFLSYRSVIEHYLIADKLDFEFCAGVINQCESNKEGGQSITSNELEKCFKTCYKGETGIVPFEKCPLCGSKTTMRFSYRGYFIGCSSYPKCNFIASRDKRYVGNKKLLKQEMIIDEAELLIKKEGINLYLWMKENVKFLRTEKDLICQLSGVIVSENNVIKIPSNFEECRMSYRQALKVKQIYTKAKNLGYLTADSKK